MNRLTYLKGERSLSRKELKNYILMFRNEIEKESKIILPAKEEIRLYNSEEFDKWFETIVENIKKELSSDTHLMDLIDWYQSSVSNVTNAENPNTSDMYY